MRLAHALPAGIIGTTLITALHEGARKIFPNTPRVELMGERAIQKFILDPLNLNVSDRTLYAVSIVGDLAFNSLSYATIVGLGAQDKKSVFARSAISGLAVGLLTWLIPPKVGLGQQPTTDKSTTRALTIAMYVVGGVASALVYNFLKDRHEGGEISDAIKSADRSQNNLVWEVEETQLIYTLN